MKTTYFNLFILLFLLFLCNGCKSWHTLEFETSAQPIQFGPHITSSSVDTLGIISGYYKQHFEDEVYSESDVFSFSFDGEDYLEETLSNSVYKALNDHPDHFISDGIVEIEVRRGVTFWGFLKNLIAGTLTGNESVGGDFYTETIRYTGIVYIIPKDSTDEQP